MNILLFSMPDSFEHMPPIAIRMPNGALTSLAGNVDPHHRVAARPRRVRCPPRPSE
jgi:anaerobic magnesium-protoporphyrin IX monomethyl ester cyclase